MDSCLAVDTYSVLECLLEFRLQKCDSGRCIIVEERYHHSPRQHNGLVNITFSNPSDNTITVTSCVKVVPEMLARRCGIYQPKNDRHEIQN